MVYHHDNRKVVQIVFICIHFKIALEYKSFFLTWCYSYSSKHRRLMEQNINSEKNREEFENYFKGSYGAAWIDLFPLCYHHKYKKIHVHKSYINIISK